MAGRVQVRWQSESAATPMGQLACFIEFLNLTGLCSRWLAGCPPTDTSPNASTKADVLGTWLLSMLAGRRPYAHVTTICCDGINARFRLASGLACPSCQAVNPASVWQRVWDHLKQNLAGIGSPKTLRLLGIVQPESGCCGFRINQRAVNSPLATH